MLFVVFNHNYSQQLKHDTFINQLSIFFLSLYEKSQYFNSIAQQLTKLVHTLHTTISALKLKNLN